MLPTFYQCATISVTFIQKNQINVHKNAKTLLFGYDEYKYLIYKTS